jgi:hypothetical protein
MSWSYFTIVTDWVINNCVILLSISWCPAITNYFRGMLREALITVGEYARSCLNYFMLNLIVCNTIKCHVKKLNIWHFHPSGRIYLIEEPWIEVQTTKWPKEKGQNGKQRTTKQYTETTDRVIRAPLKAGVNLCAPEGLAVSAPHVAPVVLLLMTRTWSM